MFSYLRKLHIRCNRTEKMPCNNKYLRKTQEFQGTKETKTFGLQTDSDLGR